MGATELPFRVVLRLTVLASCLAASTAAHAQLAPLEEEARGLFTAGRAAYDDGRYAEALEHFDAAYERSPRPELLFNIGLAAQRSGAFERAVEAFEGYLRELPNAPNRDAVEARLRDSRLSRDSQDTSSGGSSPLPWIVIGGSGAVAIAGVVLLVLAQVDVATVENVEDGGAWSDIESAHDRAPALSWAGAIMAAVGVAGAAVGTVLLLGDGGEEGAAVSVGPGSVSLRGRF
jgi:tetratricopeptide (TPR) repeat protein